MPISRHLRARYPDGWQRISERIRFGRASGMCEGIREDGTRCGAPHDDFIVRDEADPSRWRLALWHEVESGEAVRSLLSAAHLDGDPSNNTDDNLAALCQHCHTDHDRPQHLRSRRVNRDRHSGQRSLFELAEAV